MFDRSELEHTLSLHARTYRVLLWMNVKLKSRELALKDVHTSMSMHEATEHWVRRNRHLIPAEMRPNIGELNEYARMLSSYLATSFEPAAQRLISSCGCYCEFCVYLSGAHFKARMPRKKAFKTARALKLVWLKALATDQELAYFDDEIDAFLEHTTGLAEQITLGTYANELIKRTKFASQGEGVLVLWRELSRNPDGSKKDGFTLDLSSILNAERAVAGALKAGEN